MLIIAFGTALFEIVFTIEAKECRLKLCMKEIFFLVKKEEPTGQNLLCFIFLEMQEKAFSQEPG